MTDQKKTRAASDDAGQAEVQRKSDEASEKGYLGTVPAQPDNEAWTIQSGPDSPTAAELREFTAKADK